MISFGNYKAIAEDYITFIESEHYPDYLDTDRVLYKSVLREFAKLANAAENSTKLLEDISSKQDWEHRQLLRVFRKYVSPDTSVEMLEVKKNIPKIIENYGIRFRHIQEVRQNLADRPDPDDVVMAILYECKDRGKKGYILASAFFTWFDEKFSKDYKIKGPIGAGRDVMLDKVLPNFDRKIPADILISRKDGTPLVIGFARYDSDRGGVCSSVQCGMTMQN